MKYLILGGNAAGMSFAAKMKRNMPDSEIVVIEKRDYVSFGGCGLPYYVGDYFEDSQNMIVRSVDKFISQGIDLRINQEATNIDFDKKEVTIEMFEGVMYTEKYDKLIISTGSSPITLFSKTVDFKKYFTLFSLEDGEKLKEVVINNKDKKFGIIGTGFIGLELMDSLNELGCNVDIITRDKYIMDNLYDLDIIEDVQKEIKKKDNINLYLDEQITNIKEEDKIIIQTQNKNIEVDYLIFAIGFRPNSNFIDGLDKLPNGAIITDSKMQTTKEDVYALGDVATINNIVTNTPMYSPLATTANKSARALADILSSKEVAFKGMLGASILKVFDYEIARVGLTPKMIQNEGIKYKSKSIIDMNQTSYYKGQQQIKAKIYYKEDSLQILGIEMVGKKGVHARIDAMSVVITQKMTTKDLAYIDFAYAPPFSRTWDILNTLGNISK